MRQKGTLTGAVMVGRRHGSAAAQGESTKRRSSAEAQLRRAVGAHAVNMKLCVLSCIFVFPAKACNVRTRWRQAAMDMASDAWMHRRPHARHSPAASCRRLYSMPISPARLRTYCDTAGSVHQQSKQAELGGTQCHQALVQCGFATVCCSVFSAQGLPPQFTRALGSSMPPQHFKTKGS